MSSAERFKALLRSREFALLLVLVAMVLGFGLFVDGFLSLDSFLRRSRYWVATGLVAVPMTFIIATAGIDLSVGAIVALCAVTLGLLHQDAGWPIAAACLGAVAAGGAAGACNGFVVSRLRIPPLIVTLATMALFRGLAMGLTQAQVRGNFPQGFQWLSRGSVFDALGWTLPLPVSLLVLLAAVFAGHLVLRKTWPGRFIECIGENETAAEFAAIGVRALKFALYTAAGFMCGFAALFHTALFGAAKADTAIGLELEAIACVVVGGTRISGGQASVLGTFLGLCIIGTLRYGLEMAQVKGQNVIVFVGLLLIVTAVFNEWLARKTGGAR